MLFKCLLNKRVLVAQSLTLFDPMDRSPPGPSVHGILQERILGAGGGCHCLLQGIVLTKNQTRVSCIAGRFFTI